MIGGSLMHAGIIPGASGCGGGILRNVDGWIAARDTGRSWRHNQGIRELAWRDRKLDADYGTGFDTGLWWLWDRFTGSRTGFSQILPT